jgi:hypothetical protein
VSAGTFVFNRGEISLSNFGSATGPQPGFVERTPYQRSALAAPPKSDFRPQRPVSRMSTRLFAIAAKGSVPFGRVLIVIPVTKGVYFRHFLDPDQGQTGPVSWEVAPLPPPRPVLTFSPSSLLTHLLLVGTFDIVPAMRLVRRPPNRQSHPKTRASESVLLHPGPPAPPLPAAGP